MSNPTPPLLIEPDELEPLLGATGVRVVDLSKTELHSQIHIPGAVHLRYGNIVRQQPPAGGMLPDASQLSEVFSSIGLRPNDHVVAYDDEGGGKAARLLWTLDVLGHTRYSLLNGGLHAWANEGHELAREPTHTERGVYQAAVPANAEAYADREYVLAHLHDPAVALLDARSQLEYRGLQRQAARAGHIPGAVNLEWTEAMDGDRNLRLKPAADLHEQLHRLGIRDEQTVVAYCQTHHRSAHTWFVLKWLGLRAKGYAGSWSEWGNREDTPVER